MSPLHSAGNYTIRPEGHRPTLYDFHLSSEFSFWAGWEYQEAPSAVNVNIHHGMEICMGLTGLAEFSCGDSVVSVSPGDVALAAMWEPHGWKTIAPKTEHFCIVFMPEFLSEDVIGEVPWLSLFAAPPDQRPRVGDQHIRQSLLLLGQTMKREAEERPVAWEQMIRLHVSQVLILLERCWCQSARSQGQWRERYTDLARIIPALELFRIREGQVSVTDVAAACSMSRSHFDVVFKRVMGISFGRFRARARVDLATHLLITTDLSVSDIAAAAGFVDASHLHRAFVRWYGCAPGTYRQRGRQRQMATASQPA